MGKCVLLGVGFVNRLLLFGWWGVCSCVRCECVSFGLFAFGFTGYVSLCCVRLSICFPCSGFDFEFGLWLSLAVLIALVLVLG